MGAVVSKRERRDSRALRYAFDTQVDRPSQALAETLMRSRAHALVYSRSRALVRSSAKQFGVASSNPSVDW